MSSYNDVEDLDDSKSTFIDKLLVEMKSEFNKNSHKIEKNEEQNEEKENSENVDSESPPELQAEIVSETVNDNCDEPTPPKIVRNDAIPSSSDSFASSETKSVKANSSKSNKSSAKSKIVNENPTEKEDSLDESVLDESGTKTKPRIVLTFRTEKSKSVVTSSYENTKDNSSEETVSPGRRSLRIKTHSSEEKEKKHEAEIGLKRSARRRSKDCTESILQSAIARKEKSYNETTRPQRLTRRLKPTAKILANLEMCQKTAAFKSERLKQTDLKNKSVKSSPTIERQKFSYDKLEKISELTDSESEYTKSEEQPTKISEQLHKRFKRKRKHGKNLKPSPKKVKSQKIDDSKQSDSDSSSVSNQEIVDVESVKQEPKRSPRKSSSESDVAKSFRRSHRKSGRTETMDSQCEPSMPEPLSGAIAETETLSASHPESSTIEVEVSIKKCLCQEKSFIYMSASSVVDVIYCGAVDSFAGRIVGCTNVISEEAIMLRPSTRVPYMVLCEIHKERLIRHNCCPTCGLFCTQGKFVQCSNVHQYHRECQLVIGKREVCPHCGLDTPIDDIEILVKCDKTPVFLPNQKSHYPSAKMSFPTSAEAYSEFDCDVRAISPALIPQHLLEYPKADSSSESDEEYDLIALYSAVKDNNYAKVLRILNKTRLNLSEPLALLDGSTILHFASQEGNLACVHMLTISGAELDVLDKEQNTPLMVAIQYFRNSTVRYLIKVGASTTLKGTDGMTALHLAAKHGNMEACDLLLRAYSGRSRDSLARVNSADDGGWTPLVWACEHGKDDVVARLLQAGADPLLRDVEQNIALHWSAFSGSSTITQLLLDAGSDVNAVNAHGDSPLHVAARQNKYNCVIILLARGANVRLINSSEETPLDCCVLEPRECYNAISFNVQMQAVTEISDYCRKPTILTNDISRGKEGNPVQCVNMIDDEPKPNDFIYVVENCITSDIQIDRKITNLQSCQCEDRCSSSECVCSNNSLRCWYDDEGRLSTDFSYTDPPMLFECNTGCSCNVITCHNRVVQRGTNQRFQIFRTAGLSSIGPSSRGWGVISLNAVPYGTYVCEYVGEIISDTEADQREDDSYLFDLDNRVRTREPSHYSEDGETYCIDARRYGNLSRFINHSCDPNLLPVRIYIDHQDLRFPRIAFFAKKDIQAGEELGFDYGEKFWAIKGKDFTCTCGFPNCKYSKEAIQTILENYKKTEGDNETVSELEQV